MSLRGKRAIIIAIGLLLVSSGVVAAVTVFGRGALTVKVGPPVTGVFRVYNDGGIAKGDIWTWGSKGSTFNACYLDTTAPEGDFSFETSTSNWAGWGVFLGKFAENHECIEKHTVDLSAENAAIKFWVKPTSYTGPKSPDTDITVYIHDISGNIACLSLKYRVPWYPVWNEVTIHRKTFWYWEGLDWTKIWCPFSVTLSQVSGSDTFYIDNVRWVNLG